MRRVLRAIGWLILAALAPAVAHAAPTRGMIAQAISDIARDLAPQPRTTSPEVTQPLDEYGATAEEAATEDTSPTESDLPAIVHPTEEGPPPGEIPTAEPETQVPPPERPPATWRPEPSEQQMLIDADEVYYQAGATVAKGHVVVQYRDITVTADQAEIDEDHVWGQFRGNVVISRQGVETKADLIRINFDTEKWEVLGTLTTLEPSFFERGVAEPIYVRAERVEGSEETNEVDAYKGTVTSCNLPKPHYGLYSKSIRVIREQTVVLERPELRILGSRVFRFPWDLVLSQGSRNNRFFPEFGQNTVEGFYAKMAYLYLTDSTYNSYVRLNLTERRGIGFGGDHYFLTGGHSGQISLFYEPDEAALSGNARDSWTVSDRLTSDFSASLQQNTGFYGATQSLAGNLALRYRGQDSTTTLGLDTSTTDSTYNSSTRFTTSFSHRQSLGTNAGYDLSGVLRRSEYGSTGATETLDGDFQFRQRGGWYDWALAADQQWFFEGEDQRGFGLDRLPEVVFNTDSRRLGSRWLLGSVPMRASIRAGRYVQYPDEDDISMAGVETNLGGDRMELGGPFTMITTVGFDQAFYDPSAARYRLTTGLGLDGDYGGGWVSRLSHRYSTVEGFSPLRRDYFGRYNDVTLDVTQQTRDRTYLSFASGYDFVDDQWRELRLRGWLTATRLDRLELVAGYSLEQSVWRPVQTRWTHATPWDVYFALSSSYDIAKSQLTAANLEFDWRLDPRWRLEGIASYSGFAGELDQLNLRLTRDLHCWVANLTYDMASDEVRLNLGIKAFPFEDQDWTVGNRGARLGSYGQYYY